jgi:PAS domain S-box-containing protein
VDQLWAVLAACLGALLAGASVARGARRRIRSAEDATGTARRLLEDVSEAARRREVILRSMDEGILLADPNGSVVLTNEAFETLLGASPRELATITPTSIRDAALAVSRGEDRPAVETEVGSPSRWVRAAVRRVEPAGSIMIVVTDVTEAKRLDRIRRDLIANASHELKTPAATIQATAETARDAAREDPEGLQRFLEQLEKESLRLSRIVSDMLDLSRLEAGEEGTEDVGLDEVVRDEVARAHELAESSGVDLAADVAHVVVRGSFRDLALLARNLIDNAIRYTGEGGKVDVTLAREDGSAVLRVADTGIGIPSRDLPRVFERFYRVDRARSRDTGGTGLGLSIVKHVAENQGGSVSVRSELGRGSVFEVRLPAVG